MPTAPPPPQVPILMTKLEKYMHENTSTDPLVRMAVMHRRFCNIRPFDSGNGGTGRIVTPFLIKEKLLCAPILYLSGYINQTRTDYYHLGCCCAAAGRSVALYVARYRHNCTTQREVGTKYYCFA